MKLQREHRLVVAIPLPANTQAITAARSLFKGSAPVAVEVHPYDDCWVGISADARAHLTRWGVRVVDTHIATKGVALMVGEMSLCEVHPSVEENLEELMALIGRVHAATRL